VIVQFAVNVPVNITEFVAGVSAYVEPRFPAATRLTFTTELGS
jgi:hypothetical protein